MVDTNSVTRRDSVVSMLLRFSVAPLRTSWSRTLASRRRSNKALRSLRTMACVSCISPTAALEVRCDCSIAILACSCSSCSERVSEVEARVLASVMSRVMSSLLDVIAFATVTPRASIAFTVVSVMRVTSPTSAWLLVSIAVSRLPPLSSSRRVISFARCASVAFTSSALAVKLRATSAPTPSSVRSTSPAFCLSAVVMPEDRLVSVRSASSALVRIASTVDDEAMPSVCSASPAFCLTTWATPDDMAASERSASCVLARTTSVTDAAAAPSERSLSCAVV